MSDREVVSGKESEEREDMEVSGFWTVDSIEATLLFVDFLNMDIAGNVEMSEIRLNDFLLFFSFSCDLK